MNNQKVTYEIVQTVLDVSKTKVRHAGVIETTSTEEEAIVFLKKRGYTYDKVSKNWHLASFQYPLTIKQVIKENNIFDIKSFV